MAADSVFFGSPVFYAFHHSRICRDVLAFRLVAWRVVRGRSLGSVPDIPRHGATRLQTTPGAIRVNDIEAVLIREAPDHTRQNTGCGVHYRNCRRAAFYD